MNLIQGHLLDNVCVHLDARTANFCGSWDAGPGKTLRAYGQDMLALFLAQIPVDKPCVVLDIGANTGSFCLLATLRPHMTGFAFEPVPEVYELLCANLAANQVQGHMIPVALALADYTGKGTMTVPVSHRWSGHAFLGDRPADMPCEPVAVTVTTLDEFCACYAVTHIDAIKIDVEGAEPKVLRGGETVIRRDMPVILMEATSPDRTVPLLEGWGYACHDYETDYLCVRE